MGTSKLLLPGRHGCVLDDLLLAWKSGGVSAIVVVVREDDLALQAAAERHSEVNVVRADNPTEMKQSVQIALHTLQRLVNPTAKDAWLLSPADLPRLSPEIIQHLCAAHASSTQAEILVPTLAGKRGHPVLFPWPLQEFVFQLPTGTGINQLVREKPAREVPCDAITMSSRDPFADLDTPADYARYQKDETS